MEESDMLNLSTQHPVKQLKQRWDEDWNTLVVVCIRKGV